MNHGIYAHPWDLTELAKHGGMGRLADLGFKDLALAVSYHAGRWLTPWHSSAAVRFLEDGCVHFRPSKEYEELQPMPSSEVPASGPGPLASAISQLAEGMRLDAWTVLFHNSRLGRANPESCMLNARGDRYSYALCPARREVRAYGLQLLDDLSIREGLSCLELEAAGFLGYRHSSHHDKSSFLPDPVADFLLSYCFCSACSEGLGTLGADPERLRSLVAAGMDKLHGDADAMAPDPSSRDQSAERLGELVGEGELQDLLAHRLQTYRGFLAELRIRIAGHTRVALQLKPDPLFSGGQMGVPIAAVADLVDEIVMTHYGEAPADIQAFWDDLPDTDVPMSAAIWPKAPQFTSEADLRGVLQAVERRGGRGMRIYHLGLLPWKTLERVAAAI
ncbi:MAG: hypothetical protein ACYTG5_03575 [Planctomycetota bacterium]|jgi:hypothetical protein